MLLGHNALGSLITLLRTTLNYNKIQFCLNLYLIQIKVIIFFSIAFWKNVVGNLIYYKFYIAFKIA